MAQYFQVLSQGGDKSTAEGLRQLYPNLIENQTVQYVINPGDQQFQGQQIVLSTDQLMVIENQPQHVIVDQSAITYQNPQYILQENVIDYQDSQPAPQIFYMEEVESEQPIPNKSDINNSQEIVTSIRQPQLNQLHQQICVPQTSVPHIQHSRAPTHIQLGQSQLLQQRVQVQHPRQAMQQVNQQLQHSSALHQKVTANQEAVRGSSMATKNNVPPLHFTQPAVKQSEITESDNHEAVALADGRIVSLSTYKQMLADSKSFNQISAQKMTTAREKYQVDNAPKLKFKGSPRNNVRGKKVNAAVGEYAQQQNVNSPQQQQFLAHQQQMKANRQNQAKIPQNQFLQQHSQQMQNQQNKSESLQYVQPNYIIQSPSQHQPVTRCPLPSYISASQIKEIIDNTPVTDEYSDSIRMLVLLEDGEQRLITFTLPKENCTIQEILEQVGVNYHPDTKISCTEVNQSGVNYLVTVGHVDPNVVVSILYQLQGREPEEESSQASNHKMEVDNSPDKEGTADSSVEMTEPPVYKSGYLAVCNHCGITSEDFNRCARCHHKLPEEVKQIPMGEVYGNDKTNDMLNAHQTLHDKKGSLIPKTMHLLNKINGGSPTARKRKQKAVDPDPVILTLSSEDEEEPSEELSEAQKILKSLSSSVSLKAIKKEPTVNDLQEIPVTSDVDPVMDFEGVGKEIGQQFSTTLLCRTIRIGSYRYTPKENLVIESKGIVFKIPSTTDPTNIKSILMERKHMIKVLVNFQKSLPVIFYYVVPSFALYVREQLGMVKGGDFYFDPLSTEEPYKRITVLVESVNDDTKVIFKHIYTKPNNIMDELTTTEANDILIKTCPKELSKVVANAGYTEIRKILIYPPGQGGIPINTEDYVCLGQDQFLNDVIIDFYLKYLVLNLPQDLQKKVHVFSTFFYKRLTTKPIKPTKKSHPTEVDSNLSQAQKRHARVKKWTKNVNLFEKDFIVVPINENCHWFLAIICFPGMDGCYTMNGKPYVVKKQNKITKKDISSRLGSEITFTPIKKEKEEKAIPCEEDDASDKDEAEGDESELDSGEDSEELENPESSTSETTTEVAPVEPTKRSVRPPIKRPCILIFDSLTGASRVRVVSTLRGYLSCEYKVKMGVDKSFDRDTIIGNCPKIPQQTNFTDCGLYLLQYVEQFFKDPIKDYNIPIKHLENWFDEFVVTKKREDISMLIKELMLTQNRDPNLLPDIAFPTLNGKLVERLPEEEDEEFMDEFEEEDDEEDEDYALDNSDALNESVPSEPQLESDLETNLKTALPINRSRNQIKINLNQNSSLSESQSSKDTSLKSLVESPIKNVLKTNASSEVVPQSSRDALSYLKSKRIIKHNKSADQGDLKRIKLTTE